MTWEEIKMLGRAAAQREQARRLGAVLRANNGAVGDTIRELGIDDQRWSTIIRRHPQLRTLIDSSTNPVKLHQRNWRRRAKK